MAVTRCKRPTQNPQKRPVECQQLGCDAPDGATIRYRIPGPGWGYPDRINEHYSYYSPTMRVELQEYAGRWLCGWCRKLAQTRANLGRPFSAIGAGLISPIAERARRYVDDPGARTHLGDPSSWPEVARIVDRYQQRFPSKVIRLKPYRADTRLQRIVERLAEGISPLELEACIVAASEAAKAKKLDDKFQRLDALLANPGQVDRWLSETPTRVRESLGLSPRAAAS